jgi:LuxR family maltose regulon positive regulatory protein
MAMVGLLNAAESKLKTFEKAVEGNDRLMGKVATLQAITVWRRHDYSLAGKLARKALSLLPPDELESRATMNIALGSLCVGSGNLKEAEPMLTEAYDVSRRLGSNINASAALGALMWLFRQKGKLRLVAEMAQQAIELVGPSPAALQPHMYLGVIPYEWNDLEAAVSHIQRAIELGKLIGTIQVRVQIHDVLACIELARGNEAGFLKEVEKADFEARSIGEKTFTHSEHATYRIQFALRQDDLVAASDWGSKLADNFGALPWTLSHLQARLLIAQGQKSAAADQLQVLYEKAAQSGARGLMIINRLHQSLAAETEESALKFLSEALTMAEPECYIRTFVDEGKLLALLLRKVVSQGIIPDYAGKLLTIIEAEERRRLRARRGKRIIPPTCEILSEREIEVLKLLAEGLSNYQIVDKLTISLSTAKTHVHHLFEKLNAKGRVQAIARARELDLI